MDDKEFRRNLAALKSIEKLVRKDPSQAKMILVKSGIYTKSGEISRPYRLEKTTRGSSSARVLSTKTA